MMKIYQNRVLRSAYCLGTSSLIKTALSLSADVNAPRKGLKTLCIIFQPPRMLQAVTDQLSTVDILSASDRDHGQHTIDSYIIVRAL
jgi:hypothetical protein